jgi:hypothetical protein
MEYHFRDVTKLIVLLWFLFVRPGTLGLLCGL